MPANLGNSAVDTGLENEIPFPYSKEYVKAVYCHPVYLIYMQNIMLKLKLQYFGHLMQRIDSLEKTLMLGKIESRKRKG